MNREQFEGKWKQLEGRARRRWGELTDDQIERVKGRRDELVGQVQEAYGKTQEAARKEVDDWIQQL